MKKIIIEEVITQEFLVPNNASFDKVREMYMQGKLVLDNPCVIERSLKINKNEGFKVM